MTDWIPSIASFDFCSLSYTKTILPFINITNLLWCSGKGASATVVRRPVNGGVLSKGKQEAMTVVH